MSLSLTSSLLCLVASIGGLTLVTVTGTNFVASLNTYCRFDVTVVQSTVTSVSLMHCYSPAHASASVSLEVTNNNKDFTSNNVQFLYQDTESVISIFPTLGPTTGATVVTVTGSAFVSDALCRFGTIMSANTVASSSLMRCAAPSTMESTVYVEVSNNGQQWTTDSVEYRYHCTSCVVAVKYLYAHVLGVC